MSRTRAQQFALSGEFAGDPRGAVSKDATDKGLWGLSGQATKTNADQVQLFDPGPPLPLPRSFQSASDAIPDVRGHAQDRGRRVPAKTT